MPFGLDQPIEKALGCRPKRYQALSGGCIGEVYRVELDSGMAVVVKSDQSSNARLDTEGFMLSYLSEHSDLPVPEVLHSAPELLIMSYVEGNSQFPGKCEQHAAELLAALHGIQGKAHGLERETLIGGIPQPNPWTDSWVDFFRDHRLRYMAGLADNQGRLPGGMRGRIEDLAGKLEALLPEPPHPSLLHGDVWTTNVLARGGRITAFLDPAVYHGHPEIELAFITLFHTFGNTFFSHYGKLRGIEEGFFETRRDIYNLYPLLVHVYHFGAGYLSGIESTLRKHGC